MSIDLESDRFTVHLKQPGDYDHGLFSITMEKLILYFGTMQMISTQTASVTVISVLP